MDLTSMTKKELIEEIEKRDRELDDLSKNGHQAVIQRLYELINHLPGGIIIETPEREVLQVNHKFCEIFGIDASPETMKGADAEQAARQVKHLFADSEGFLRRIEEILAAGEEVLNEELPLSDGRVFERDYVPVEVYPGRVENMWHYRDISERKVVEEGLHKSRERLKKVLEVETAGVMFWDMNTWRMTDANDAFLAFLGYSRRELEAGELTWQKLTPPEYIQQSHDEIRKLQETGRIGPYEKEYLRKDGTRKWFVFAGSSLGDETCVEFCVDISGRKQAEEALRESEKKYRAVFKNTGAASCIIEEDTTLSLVNKQFEKLAGLPTDKIEGKMSWTDFVLEEDLNRMREYHDSRRKAGEKAPTSYEFRFVDSEEELHHIFLTIDVIAGTKESVASLLDITDRKRMEEQLKSQKERLSNIIESTNMGTWEWNVQTGETVFNEKWANIIGYSLEEISPVSIETWMKYAHPDDLERSNALLEKHFRGELDYYHFECRMKHRDGHWVWVLDHGKVVSWTEDGNPLWMYGTHQDITERKQMREAIASERDLSNKIIDSLPGMFYLFDQSGHFLRWNKSFEALTGYTPEEISGLHPRELFRGEDRKLIEEGIRRVFEDGHAEAEAEMVTRENQTIPCYFNGNRIVFEGRPCLVGMGLDVTERKKAEAALQQSEEKFRSVFNQSPLGIYIHDLEGHIVDVNSTACRQLGYSEKEISELSVFDFHPKDRTGINQPVDEIMKLWKSWNPGDVHTISAEHQRKDGTVFPVEISTGIVRFGEKRMVLALVQDITGRKRLEEQLQQAQKMEAVGQLAGGVAHDFNNLLTVIIGYTDLLLMTDLPSEILNPIEQIKQASERANRLTAQLLAFSRKQIIRPEVINLNSLITNQMKMLSRLLGEDIEIATLLYNDLGNIKADPGQIEQIIMNITINARDAMPKGGRLTLETSNVEFDEDYQKKHPEVHPGKYVMLAITDTGVGMDRATRGRVFEPFFTTKGRDKGTGLGLATVYGIVKQNDGFIYVYSESQKGTTFKIYLPMTERDENQASARSENRREFRGSETILLVEDNLSVRKLTHSTLADYGYDVITASNGEEALNIFNEQRGRIDLLLTDVIMPLMGGRELAEKLSSENPQLKIIYFSGYADKSIVNHGVLKEGVEFIQKPYSHIDLAKKVRQVLDRV